MNNPVKAATGRRFLALIIDWLMCLFISSLVGFESRPISTLVIFFIQVSILTTLQQVPVQKVLLRTFLICLVLPAVFARDGRGLHDWVANSIVVRNPKDKA
jgi:uncharacterized RDD family membrane protein YckC